jgi:hypothetical protein
MSMEVIKMPGGDGTGPIGQGPMTGRAFGFCAEYPNSGYSRPVYGLGYGRGWGRGIGRGYWGRGRRFWYREIGEIPLIKSSTEEEKVCLENLVKNLEDELKAVTERLKNLSKEKEES